MFFYKNNVYNGNFVIWKEHILPFYGVKTNYVFNVKYKYGNTGFLSVMPHQVNGRMDIIRVNVKKNVQQKLMRRWVFRNVSFGDSHCIQIVIR